MTIIECAKCQHMFYDGPDDLGICPNCWHDNSGNQ